MSRIPFYKNITERNIMFRRIEIKNFNNLLDALKEDAARCGFFRGQADSSWKLYSYLQREYILKDLGRQFESPMKLFQELINLARIRNNKEIIAQCQDQYDLAVGSVLQHYGCPTPFIDFSESFDVALFFATKSVQNSFDFETNNFFSIYIFFEGGTPATPEHDFMNYTKIFSIFKNKLEKIENEIEEKNVKFPDIAELKNLDTFSEFQMLILKDTDEEWLKIKNPRLNIQKGLFIYSGQSELRPYEEIIQPLPENVDHYEKMTFDKMKVYDIPKSIRSDVQEYLKKKKICLNSLGFSTHSWGEEFYDDFIVHVMR